MTLVHRIGQLLRLPTGTFQSDLEGNERLLLHVDAFAISHASRLVSDPKRRLKAREWLPREDDKVFLP